jgi:hypothetical protein
MPAPENASDALRMAMTAMENGHWDKRSQEGSRLNALDSIAWSLIGILSHMERTTDGAPTAREAKEPRRRHRDERDKLDLGTIQPSA